MICVSFNKGQIRVGIDIIFETAYSSTCNSLYTASGKLRELLLVSRCLMCTRNCPPGHLHGTAAITLHRPWSVGATKIS